MEQNGRVAIVSIIHQGKFIKSLVKLIKNATRVRREVTALPPRWCLFCRFSRTNYNTLKCHSSTRLINFFKVRKLIMIICNSFEDWLRWDSSSLSSFTSLSARTNPDFSNLNLKPITTLSSLNKITFSVVASFSLCSRKCHTRSFSRQNASWNGASVPPCFAPKKCIPISDTCTISRNAWSCVAGEFFCKRSISFMTANCPH